MFFASSSLKRHQVEVLLDRHNPTPYHYATPKVGHLPPVKRPPSPAHSQTPPHISWPLG